MADNLEKIKISELPPVVSYVNLYTIGTDGNLTSVKVPLFVLSQIGDLSQLTTQNKSSLVAAINEAAQTGGGGDVPFHQVAVLITDNTPGVPFADATIANDTLTITFHHLKGDKGDSASDLDNLVYIGIDEGPAYLPLPYYEEQSNKVQTLTENSTDEQYPSARCVYLALQNISSGAAWGSITGNIVDQTDLKTILDKKYEKPQGGIPATDLANGVIPSVPTISTSVTDDANSDTKTSSPKSVKTYVDSVVGNIETALANIIGD